MFNEHYKFPQRPNSFKWKFIKRWRINGRKDSGKELSSTQKRGVYHANNARTHASQTECCVTPQRKASNDVNLLYVMYLSSDVKTNEDQFGHALRENCFVVLPILVPRGCSSFGQHQETRPLRRSNTGSRFTDFPSLCACSQSTLRVWLAENTKQILCAGCENWIPPEVAILGAD